MAFCPECDTTIEMEEDEVEEGQILECPECDAKLEVVNTHPLELDLIPEEKDDEDEAGT